MDQQMRDGDQRILGSTTSSLIGCILAVIYVTTAILFSESPHTWDRHKSIESTAKHKREAGILVSNVYEFVELTWVNKRQCLTRSLFFPTRFRKKNF